MKSYRFVTLDPTGNLTCLVLDPVDPADEAAVTRQLLKQCEQVAYLVPPDKPEAVAGIRLMGGEFCGNAAMAAAAWLVRDEIAAGEEKALLLEVSGAADPVRCTVRKTAAGFEGTVEMPGVPEIGKETLCGIPFTVVRMEGIVHLVCESGTFEPETAETLLREIAAQLPDKAAGLLQWDSRSKYMKPLVFVRKSGTLVWETGCGSGSTAVGAWLASLQQNGVIVTDVHQPGGIIRVEADAVNGNIKGIRISGRVRIGKTETMFLEE